MPTKKKIYELKKGEKIPLMYDECARIMFSNPNRMEPITLLVSKILNVDYQKIEGKIELLPTRQDNVRVNKKKTECDIVVKVDFDKTRCGLIIEINVKDRFYETVINRNIFYMNRLFGNDLNEHDTYKNISDLYLINFNTFFTDDINKNIFDYYYFMNSDGHILTEKQKILNINIAECHKLLYDKSEIKYKNAYEKDLFYLSAALYTNSAQEFNYCISKIDTLGRIKDIFMEVSSDMNSDEELLSMYYNKEEDEKRIWNGIIEEEKEIAREEGHAEGIKQNRLEIIKNLVKMNMKIDDISQVVNLPINEVEKIIDECNLIKK